MSESNNPADPAFAGPDPSMDEILASIRRILNEEAPALSEPPHSEPHPDSGYEAAGDGDLVLDNSMLVNEDPMNAETNTPAGFPAQPSPSAGFEPHPALVAPESAAAATSSVGELVRTLSANRGTPVSRTGPTIEDLVRDEIRPVLKAWLDQHLPPIVERMVRIEIERVISRSTP